MLSGNAGCYSIITWTVKIWLNRPRILIMKTKVIREVKIKLRKAACSRVQAMTIRKNRTSQRLKKSVSNRKCWIWWTVTPSCARAIKALTSAMTTTLSQPRKQLIITRRTWSQSARYTRKHRKFPSTLLKHQRTSLRQQRQKYLRRG